jgi:hypothetical protein
MTRSTGLVKNHFYAIWILLRVFREKKEVRQIHGVLSKLQIPTYLGRLPTLMGTTAGGSLSADQWLISAIAALPVMIPQIYEHVTHRLVDGDAILTNRKLMFAKAREAKKAKAKAAKARKPQTKKAKAGTAAAQVTSIATLLETNPDSPGGRRSSRSRVPTPRAQVRLITTSTVYFSSLLSLWTSCLPMKNWYLMPESLFRRRTCTLIPSTKTQSIRTSIPTTLPTFSSSRTSSNLSWRTHLPTPTSIKPSNLCAHTARNSYTYVHSLLNG